MEKNWLIRTKSNHILGPISKEKLRELYRNGSIKPDDEVCSGNGYWFYLRENDLVEKYLLGNDLQTFNPISEAKDVLTKSQEIQEANNENAHSETDLTLVGAIKIPDLNNENKSQDDQIKINSENSSSPVNLNLHELAKKNKKNKTGPENSKQQSNTALKQPKKTELKKQGFLKWLGIVVFIILFCLIYFRKRIINELIENEFTLINFNLFPDAYANDLEKKKI